MSKNSGLVYGVRSRVIEDKFQELAESVIRGRVQEINEKAAEKVSDFFMLWHLRFDSKNNPSPPVKLNVIELDLKTDKYQQEWGDWRESN